MWTCVIGNTHFVEYGRNDVCCLEVVYHVAKLCACVCVCVVALVTIGRVHKKIVHPLH